MKKAQMIETVKAGIEKNAYKALVFEQLNYIDSDGMYEYESTIAYGKAFAYEEMYRELTGTSADEIIETSQAQALDDIKGADYDIDKLKALI